MQGQYIFVPLETAQTPADGHAYVNKWWCVDPEKGVVFYVSRLKLTECGEPVQPSPQCNDVEWVAKKMNKRMSPQFEVRLIPVVYAAHARRELVRLVKLQK